MVTCWWVDNSMCRDTYDFHKTMPYLGTYAQLRKLSWHVGILTGNQTTVCGGRAMSGGWLTLQLDHTPLYRYLRHHLHTTATTLYTPAPPLPYAAQHALTLPLLPPAS